MRIMNYMSINLRSKFKYIVSSIFSVSKIFGSRAAKPSYAITQRCVDTKNHSVTRRGMIKFAGGGALCGLAAMSAGNVSTRDVALGRLREQRSTRPQVSLEKPGIQIVFTGMDRIFPYPFQGASNVTIIIDGRVLQFGFGRGTMQNLMAAGISPLLIDEVYLPSLEFQAQEEYKYFTSTSTIAGNAKDIAVFGPPGLKVSMVDILPFARNSPMRKLMERKFKVTELEAGIVGFKDLYTVTASRDLYIGGRVRSLTYRVDSVYGSVAISSGFGSSNSLHRLSDNVDILLHEFTLPEGFEIVGRSLEFDSSSRLEFPGIMSPATLGRLAREANVRILAAYLSSAYTYPSIANQISEMSYSVSEELAEHFGGQLVFGEDMKILTMN